MIMVGRDPQFKGLYTPERMEELILMVRRDFQIRIKPYHPL